MPQDTANSEIHSLMQENKERGKGGEERIEKSVSINTTAAPFFPLPPFLITTLPPPPLSLLTTLRLLLSIITAKYVYESPTNTVEGYLYRKHELQEITTIIATIIIIIIVTIITTVIIITTTISTSCILAVEATSTKTAKKATKKDSAREEQNQRHPRMLPMSVSLPHSRSDRYFNSHQSLFILLLSLSLSFFPSFLSHLLTWLAERAASRGSACTWEPNNS